MSLLVMLLGLFLVLTATDCLIAPDDPKAEWNLPLVPSFAKQKTFKLQTTSTTASMNKTSSPANTAAAKATQKRIPKHCWIAFFKAPDNQTMKGHTRRMVERNTPLGWTFHLAGNEEKLAFMRKYYANTSTLWAYENIHPRVGNSAADIWRYAVLYLFGGLYLDDDSYFDAKFDEVSCNYY